MDRVTLLRRYKALVDLHEGIEVKGKKMPYTSLNGNMFSFLSPEGGLCFRLSDADRAEFAKAHGERPVSQYGAVMRGYVDVPDSILTDDVALEALFARCVSHARSLKPKPTKK